MDILPLSKSIHLQSYEGTTSIKLKRAFKLNVASSTTFKGNPKANPSFITDYSLQINSNYRPMFQELALDPKELVIGQSLVNGPYYEAQMDEELEQEIESVILNLKRAMERVREIEMMKFFGRRKEAAEIEDVEKMSEEIVAKLLEKPIQYLRSGNGNLKVKIRDVNLLVSMLDNLKE